MEYVVFQWIHQWVGRFAALDAFMIFLAQWLTPLLVIVVAVVGMEQLWRTRKLPWPMAALMAGAMGWLIQFCISLVLFFPRPFALLGFSPLVSHNPLDSAFPSGHASFLFGMAWYLALVVPPRTTRLGSPSTLAGLNGSALLSSATPRNHARKASAVLFMGDTTRASLFFFVAFLVSIARVYTGVHWPLDIAGGVFVGLLAACVMHLFLNFFHATRRHREHKIRRT